MCLAYAKKPDEIVDYLGMNTDFLFSCWASKLIKKSKTDYDMALFLGSFSNHEMAKQIYSNNNPDVSSTEDTEIVLLNAIKMEEQTQQHKKKRKYNKQA